MNAAHVYGLMMLQLDHPVDPHAHHGNTVRGRGRLWRLIRRKPRWFGLSRGPAAAELADTG